MHLLLASLVFTAIFKASTCSIAEMRPPPGIDEAKKEMDENQITEEQFFWCFSDINCVLGEDAKNEMFACYRKVAAKDVTEYCSWFRYCPVGNFTIPTLEDNHPIFCGLDRDGQDVVNKYFIENVVEKFQDVCKDDKKTSGKCFRLQRAVQCVATLIETYTADGRCETIVKTMEEPMKEGMMKEGMMKDGKMMGGMM